MSVARALLGVGEEVFFFGEAFGRLGLGFISGPEGESSPEAGGDCASRLTTICESDWL